VTARGSARRPVERREPRLPARHGYGLVLLLIVATYVPALLADRQSGDGTTR
jgi:hypothetical protein